MVAKNTRIGYVKVSGSRPNSAEKVNHEFNHRDASDQKKRDSAAHLVAAVRLVSEGVPLLGETQEAHENIVRKMRLRVAWTQGIHTPNGIVIDDKGKQIALELMEALGVDKLSQDEANFRVVGPTSAIWDRGVVR